VQPIVLGPNMPETFYRGAGRIDRLRGTSGHEDRPEDWIASVTSRFGTATDGMTRLPDGSLLAEAVAADPEAWLGAEHATRYGSDTGLLVKLLDAGQRLPVHVHPDRRFAAEHLASPHGKTEAWIVLEAEPGAAVYLGFSRDVGADELAGWARSQDVTSLLAATNRVPVAVGDSVLCPAGTPHAISAGILVVELQEPADLSIMMEWDTFGLAEQEATLGLPLDEALACVNRRACPPERLDALRGRPLNSVAGSLLPAEGNPFFVAERVDTRTPLSRSYGVLVVTAGEGQLATEDGGSVPVGRGSTVLIPYAAGPAVLTGTVEGVRCLPASLALRLPMAQLNRPRHQRSVLPEKISRKNRKTLSTSRKIEAASNGAEAISVLVRRRWKSNMVNPAKMTRPSTA
jgi:mannose-6-phosphate isomerase